MLRLNAINVLFLLKGDSVYGRGNRPLDKPTSTKKNYTPTPASELLNCGWHETLESETINANRWKVKLTLNRRAASERRVQGEGTNQVHPKKKPETGVARTAWCRYVRLFSQTYGAFLKHSTSPFRPFIYRAGGDAMTVRGRGPDNRIHRTDATMNTTRVMNR